MIHLEQRGRGEAALALAPFRPVVVVPTYDNANTIERVVRAVQAHVPYVVVVDDAGGEAAQRALRSVAEIDGVVVLRRADNGGKGAAVKDGLRWAHHAGFTHALQVDADDQHDLASAPALLAAARESPRALVLSRPLYDDSAPAARRFGRWISIFWIRVATLLDRGHIDDPMCGFRVYPLAATVPQLQNTGERMDFDPEIAVRLVWQGLDVVNIDARVRYFEDGVSHYRVFWDNVLVSFMHARLCMLRFTRLYRWM